MAAALEVGRLQEIGFAQVSSGMPCGLAKLLPGFASCQLLQFDLKQQIYSSRDFICPVG
jgi:hypothetical protein